MSEPFIYPSNINIIMFTVLYISVVCNCLCMVLSVSLQGYNNSKGVTLEASFTPDSQFVMIGK